MVCSHLCACVIFCRDDSWEEISLEEKTTEVYDETFDKYLLQARYFPVFCVVASRETRDLSNLPADVDKNSVKITYTAMHGSLYVHSLIG